MEKTPVGKTTDLAEVGFAVLGLLIVFVTLAVTCNWINSF